MQHFYKAVLPVNSYCRQRQLCRIKDPIDDEFVQERESAYNRMATCECVSEEGRRMNPLPSTLSALNL